MTAPRRVLLIDADILAYAAAATAERAVCWGPAPLAGDLAGGGRAEDPDDALWSTYTEPGATEAALEEEIARLTAAFDAAEARFFLTAGASFRARLSARYKAHRRDRRRPSGLAAARAYLRAAWKAEEEPGLEADDLLSMALTAPPTAGEERICLSADKDLLSAPGLHGVVDDAGRGRVRRVTLAEADRRHLTQTLVGDAVDGYPGCPGVGPARAARILGAALPSSGGGARAWRAVTQAYRIAGLSEADALLQARLARLLRHGDYDADRRAPRLWEPPHAVAVAGGRR